MPPTGAMDLAELERNIGSERTIRAIDVRRSSYCGSFGWMEAVTAFSLCDVC